MEKKKYVKPVLETEEFVPQEYIAVCYVDAYTYSGMQTGIIAEDVPNFDRDVEDGGSEHFTHIQLGTCNGPCDPTGIDFSTWHDADIQFQENNNTVIDGIAYVNFDGDKVYHGKTNLYDKNAGATLYEVGCFFIEQPVDSPVKNFS